MAVLSLSKNTLVFCIFLIICRSEIHLCSKFKSNLQNKSSSESKNTEKAQNTAFNSNYQYIVSGECDASTCEFGKCKDKNTCICDNGYGQLQSDTSAKMCSYKLKEQLVAFLLETFLIIGIGHFYCSRIVFGILKLLFLLIVLLLDFILKKLTVKSSVNKQNLSNGISYILYFAFIGFHIYDIVMFGASRYADGNGMPLYIRE